MHKQAGFFDFFKNRKQDIYSYIDQNIDPHVEELRKIIEELRALSRSSNEARQLFWNMKEIFYHIQTLKKTVLNNTKTAQTSNFTKKDQSFYMSRLSDLLKNLMNNSKAISDMTDNENIKRQIYQTNKIINENVYMIEDYQKNTTKNEDSKHPTVPFDYHKEQQTKINEMPNFFKNFVKTLSGYEEHGSFVDVEAIRGMLSTWIRNHGLSLLDQNLGEYKSRYMPVSTFVSLINGEPVERTDKRKLKERIIEPT